MLKHPYSHGLLIIIPSIYGKMGDGFLLLYHALATLQEYGCTLGKHWHQLNVHPAAATT